MTNIVISIDELATGLGAMAGFGVVMWTGERLFKRLMGPLPTNELRYAPLAAGVGAAAAVTGLAGILAGLLGAITMQDGLTWIMLLFFSGLGAWWIVEAVRWRMVVGPDGLAVRSAWGETLNIPWANVKRVSVNAYSRNVVIDLTPGGQRIRGPFGLQNVKVLVSAARANGVEVRT